MSNSVTKPESKTTPMNTTKSRSQETNMNSYRSSKNISDSREKNRTRTTKTPKTSGYNPTPCVRKIGRVKWFSNQYGFIHDVDSTDD